MIELIHILIQIISLQNILSKMMFQKSNILMDKEIWYRLLKSVEKLLGPYYDTVFIWVWNTPFKGRCCHLEMCQAPGGRSICPWLSAVACGHFAVSLNLLRYVSSFFACTAPALSLKPLNFEKPRRECRKGGSSGKTGKKQKFALAGS